MGWTTRDDADEGWFHVLNRGVDRCEVFRDGYDARQFLGLLGAATVEHGVELHAYCLLGNHYHLLVHAPDGGLSTMAQRFSSVYVRRFNLRHDRDGPLFRSRFRSIRIGDESYLDNVGRYIHRNALDRFPNRAPRHYKWSSMQWYVGRQTCPDWLHTEKLLSFHTTRQSFDEFVVGGVQRPGDAEWAIKLAIAMSGDDKLTSLPQLDRTLASLLVVGDNSEGDACARRKATRRAEGRLANYPAIADLVEVARGLIGPSSHREVSDTKRASHHAVTRRDIPV